jgi:hypothetical protein
MSLKVMDGLRTVDGANAAVDIAIANYASGNTMNGTSHDMKDHFEFLVSAQAGVVTGTAVVTIVVQESNEAAANFANVASAAVSFANNANSNQAKLISVNWKHPDRKRYARVQGLVTVANAAFYGVHAMRVAPHGGPVTADSALTGV